MKIGIITHYYQSTNYGGNLQAYALCKKLLDNGIQAEQISFSFLSGNGMSRYARFAEASFMENVKKAWNYACAINNKYQTQYNDRKIANNLLSRKAAVLTFNKVCIPHSERVYTAKTIQDCVDYYDGFITGSDQVWNPLWYFPPFFLNFVPVGKKKLSYAASISQSELSLEQREIFRENLKDFSAISVREASAAELIQDLSQVCVTQVLDPTLLLSNSEWDTICAERMIREPYLFCYFMEADQSMREKATSYAKRKHLKTVTLPHLSGHFRMCDANFGDIQLYDVSPECFLSLIKYADEIFTDSFHGTAFSCLYQKQFLVFARSGQMGMDTRITSLMSLFHTEKRFCNSEEWVSLAYIEGLAPIDYSHPLPEFEKMKRHSEKFLFSNLSKVID